MPQSSPSSARAAATADLKQGDPGSTTSGLEGLLEPIEAALESACDLGDGCPPELAEAMRYALLAPGKRLRPAMCLMAAEACGGTIEAALPGAVAVEMIHAYSLIHDDLPAMDDDDLRRGRPTVHIRFDEATAILAGDALQAEAFAHLGREIQSAEKLAESVRVLARAAGATRLVGGQADDLSQERRGEDDPGTLEQLESIHRRKTGALIAASFELGAILSGATPAARARLADYADNLGLAFQVVDDLLDHTGQTAAMGKRVGKDANRGKLTYPGLLGLEASRAKAEQLIAAARENAAVFGAAGWRLAWLAGYVLERKH